MEKRKKKRLPKTLTATKTNDGS